MIPLFAILCFLGSLPLLGSGVRIYLAYRRTQYEWYSNLSKSLFGFALFFLFLGMTMLFPNNLIFIELCLDLALLFFYLGMGFNLLVPFRVQFFKGVNLKILSWIVVLIGIAIFFFNILNIEPAINHTYNNFIFWEESRLPFINIFSGVLFILFFVNLVIFFLIQGFQEKKEKSLRTQIFLMTFGFLLLIIGMAVRFIFYYWMDIFKAWLITITCFGVAMIILVVGMFLLKPQKEKFIKEEVKI